MKELKTKKEEVLSKMSISEIKSEIKDAEKKMFSLRMKLSLWELKQTHMIKWVRKYIAKMNTLLTAKINNN